MAYFNQEKKKLIAPQIKKVLKKYGLKGNLGVENHSTVRLTIKSGKLDFINDADYKHGDDYLQVNHFYIREHFSGKSADALSELKEILNTNNYNRSDIMVDHFDVGHYISIEIGRWDKPYILEK